MMIDPPFLSVTRPLTGFLARWLAAWVLPGCVTVPVFIAAIYLGDRYTSPGLYYTAMAVVLAQPVLLAVAHARLMRGRLRRPRLWGVMTGGGVAIAALGATVVLPGLVQVVVAPSPSPGVPNMATVATYYASAGLLFGLIVGLLQSTALGAIWTQSVAWSVVSALGSLVASSWIWAWAEVGALSGWADSISGSLFLRGEWRAVPAVTGWIAAAVLLHALPTGLAMRRLLRRRAATESAALAARFD